MEKRKIGAIIGILTAAILIGGPAFMVYAKSLNKNNLVVVSQKVINGSNSEIKTPKGLIEINSPRFDALYSQEVSSLVNKVREEKGLKPLNTNEPVNNEAAIYKVKNMDITGVTQKCSNGETLAQIYNKNQNGFTGWDLKDILLELPVTNENVPISDIKALAQETVSKLLQNGIILTTDHTYQGAAIRYYNGAVRVAYVVTNHSEPKGMLKN